MIINNSTNQHCQQSLPDGDALEHRSDQPRRLKDLGEDGGISDRGDKAPVDGSHNGQTTKQHATPEKDEVRRKEGKERREKEG